MATTMPSDCFLRSIITLLMVFVELKAFNDAKSQGNFKTRSRRRAFAKVKEKV